jgi:hypothetical protein
MATLMERIEQEENALTAEEKRFLLDLEFIQSLANPSYLQCTSCLYSIDSVVGNANQHVLQTLQHMKPSICSMKDLSSTCSTSYTLRTPSIVNTYSTLVCL